MSGLDTHLEKQPISPINGQTGDINKDSSAKGVIDKHLAALEGTKETIDTETFLASCHGELGERIKDNEDKVKESNKEMAVNGIEESVGEQEKGLPWCGASHVEETKHFETCNDLEDGKQVDSEGGDVETGMEDGNAAGSKDPEPKTEVVAMETKEEQGQSSTESKERESVTPVSSDEQSESSAKNKDPEESLCEGAGKCSNEHQDKSSLEIKEAENSAATDDLETSVVKHGEDKQNGESTCITPAAVEMKREHVEASGVKKESELSLEVNGETGLGEVGNNHTKPEEEEEDPSMSEEALNGEPLEGHTLEKTKVAETEPGTEDKSAASPDSSPNALKQKSNENETKPDQPIPAGVAAGSETSPIKEQEDDSKRSRTKWYTSDQPEDTPTKPEISATSEESISYSTTIVGGVVHRMPISSSSPKGQHKPIRQGSPQTPPKKKTVLGSLLGRPKKLKGGPENPAGPFTDGKGDKNKEQKGLPEAATVAENSEKENVEKPSEASSVAGVDSANETEKDTAEPLENEKNPDVENVGVIKTEKGTEDEEEAVEQEDVDGKPAVMKVDEEGIKAKTVGAEDEPKQDEKDLQDVTEDSVAAKNVKNSDGSTEGPKNEDSKEAVQSTSESRGSTGKEVHSSGVPTAKKSKSAGIFGGFFARRKSKKSTSPSEGKTVEKKEDKIEESQHVDSSAQLSGEVSGTEQGTSSDGAAAKGEQDLTVPPKVVTEDDHHPAADETTDSGVSEIVDKDKDKVDTADVGEDPVARENVKEKTDVENTVSGNIQELSQETLQSEETSKTVKTVAEETTAFVAKDSEPEVQQVEQNLTQPKTEVSNVSAAEGETGNDKPKPEEPKNDEAPMQTGNEASPDSLEGQDEATELTEPRVTPRNAGNTSYSPTRHMHMRISYAERDGEGAKEVEVIGTPENSPEITIQKGRDDHRVSCRGLGEADHEGWLSKKGGMLFLTGWKRKWVVLKDGKLYYFKTAFDPEASGLINMKGAKVTEARESKKPFCFKCEEPGSKPQVSIFMAHSKEDMDKWLRVLTSASRGEIIQKPKQHHMTVKGEVTLRKRTGSSSAQRHSSVLAIASRHDFLEDKEQVKLSRRSSTPGSVSNFPEIQEIGKRTAALGDTPHDAPSEPSNEQKSPDEAPPLSLGGEKLAQNNAPLVPRDDKPAPSDTQAELSNDDQLPGNAPLSLGGEKPVQSDTPSDTSSDKIVPSENPVAPTDPSRKVQLPDDAPSAVSVALPACTDKLSTLRDEPPAPSNEHLAPSDSQLISEPSDEASEEKFEDGEHKSSENADTDTAVVSEIIVEEERVIVESTLASEISPPEPQIPSDKSSKDATPAVLLENRSKNCSEVPQEVLVETEKQDSTTDADKTDGGKRVSMTESDVETEKTALELSENARAASAVSEVRMEPKDTSNTDVKEIASEVVSSESSVLVESETPDTSAVPLESPSGKTRWYFSLDRKQTWSVAPEPEEEEKSTKRLSSTLTRITRKSTSSERETIKSTSSDAGSIKSLPEDDELMTLCHNIKKARLSVVGDHLWDSAERMRAFSHARDSDKAMVKLRGLERILKDKERQLGELDDLLNQPEINRKSIYDWKLRNSGLLEELLPQDSVNEQEGDGDAGEGGESEKQDQENVDAKLEGKKSDDAEEEKEAGNDNIGKQQAVPNQGEKSNEGLEVVADGQDSSEKKESNKNQGNEAEEGDNAQAQSLASVLTETTDVNPEDIKDTSTDVSMFQQSAEVSADTQQTEETLDTRF
ncbi:uncharacterized protein [Montipora foliosa]|uniref:uncharacterized protein n=1 Tax=Montipora foliosa TaxID=591990 RepID=UPI0035F18717